jgi:hypothetical protein
LGLNPERAIVPRKHLYIYIAITIVAVVAAFATQPIIDYVRHLIQGGAAPHP